MSAVTSEMLKRFIDLASTELRNLLLQVESFSVHVDGSDMHLFAISSNLVLVMALKPYLPGLRANAIALLGTQTQFHLLLCDRGQIPSKATIVQCYHHGDGQFTFTDLAEG
jgi:hypothetical protein